MSAFLGPIHHWLYNKIQFQDRLTDRLLQFYEEGQHGTALRAHLNEKYGRLEQAPLETIIDGANIHGWLQQRVTLVEYRYAEAVTVMLQDCALQDLEKVCRAFGRENKPESPETAKDLFQFMNDTLLDGMPCDHANAIVTENNDGVVWQRNVCVHEAVWEAVGGEICHYYALRDALLEGMLDGSGFVYEKPGEEKYAIKRNV